MLTGGKPPVWASVLIAAEDWGQPPWIIAGGDPVTWFYRWAEYKHWRNRAEEQQMKRAARRNKHG